MHNAEKITIIASAAIVATLPAIAAIRAIKGKRAMRKDAKLVALMNVVMN